MPLRDRQERLFFGDSVIFGLAGLHTMMHLVTAQPFGATPLVLSLVVAALLTILFLTAAVSLIFRARSPFVFAMAFDLSCLSVLALIWHGCVARLQGDYTGIVYILAAFPAAYMLRKGFAPIVHPTSEHPAQPREHEIVGRGVVLEPI